MAEIKKRVAFLLLDGVELESIEYFRADGLTPNLDRLMTDGRMVPVDSRDNFSAEATPTEMLTGQTAEELRYWSLLKFDPDTYVCTNTGAYRGDAFYDRDDLRSIVFDVPHMRIDPSTPGLQVAAWGAHSAQFPRSSNPPHVIVDLEAEFGPMHTPAFEDIHASHNLEWGRGLTDHMLDSLDKRPKVLEWLMEREPDWDLMVVGSTETHVHEHAFHHVVEPDHELRAHPATPTALGYMRELFVGVDRMVGEVEAMMPEGTTFLVGAMHGAKPSAIDSSSILAAELVYRDQTGNIMIDLPRQPASPVMLDPHVRARSYIQRYKRSPGRPQSPGMKSAAIHYVRWASHRFAPLRVEHEIERFTRRMQGLSPEWWRKVPAVPLTEPIDLDAPFATEDISTEPSNWYHHAWGDMRYFVLPSFSSLQIRVNLEGRERDGKVKADDYEAALDEAEVLLRAMTSARTGQPIVERVTRLRTDDPFAADGPPADMAITLAAATTIDHPTHGRLGTVPIGRSSEHSERGWIVAQDQSVRRRDDANARPIDLAPTMVHLLGLPPLDRYSGRPIFDSTDTRVGSLIDD